MAMTPEQRARLEEYAADTPDGTAAAALAHIDALEARVKELDANNEALLAFRDQHVEDEKAIDALAAEVESAKENAAHFQAHAAMLAAEVERLKDEIAAHEIAQGYTLNAKDVDPYVRAEARATAAEQRVRAVELLQATWRADLAATAARLREVEAERDEARGEAVAHEADAAALRHAKAQAEQTAAKLREALREYGHHARKCEAREGGVCYCGLDAALHGQAAQEDARG